MGRFWGDGRLAPDQPRRDRDEELHRKDEFCPIVARPGVAPAAEKVVECTQQPPLFVVHHQAPTHDLPIALAPEMFNESVKGHAKAVDPLSVRVGA